LHDAAEKVVEDGEYKPKEPLVFRRVGDVNRAFNQAVKASGILHCTIRDLRVTALTDGQDAGLNQNVLRDFAGHASVLTTQGYQQPSIENKRRVAESLAARLAGVPVVVSALHSTGWPDS
ncbi:MAG: site-specific integrase, partial [Proteobacteria bacterium]|nr:site-specific integrase [Pseudomonadota bacterium]